MLAEAHVQKIEAHTLVEGLQHIGKQAQMVQRLLHGVEPTALRRLCRSEKERLKTNERLPYFQLATVIARDDKCARTLRVLGPHGALSSSARAGKSRV